MIRLLTAILFAIFSILFSFAFYQRYWRWRDCFNEEGRCFDPLMQDVFLEQAGIGWGTPAVVCLAIAVVLLIPARKANK